jgi:hypothetical protein
MRQSANGINFFFTSLSLLGKHFTALPTSCNCLGAGGTSHQQWSVLQVVVIEPL